VQSTKSLSVKYFIKPGGLNSWANQHRDRDFSICQYQILKLVKIILTVETRFSRLRRPTLCQCQDQESRSRLRRDKSRPPGLYLIQEGALLIVIIWIMLPLPIWSVPKWLLYASSTVYSSVSQSPVRKPFLVCINF
jgi:hypothetical protein